MAIRIAPQLELPLDVVTQAMAILARRGAGKTYAAGVLVEQVVKAGLPVVVLDPTGAWWGLRTSADGQKPGLPVVIFGGAHGDVPLERGAGREIADVIVEHPGAYVIDLSGFESKAAEQAFAADFLERLYRAKSQAKDALLVVVDEADFFAPQQPRDKGDQLRTLGALEAIVRRGRIRGLGVLLITQRAAVLNKNVLTQVEVLIVMQTTGPQDLRAIDEWITHNATTEQREQVLGSLAGLERGQAWIWSPSWLRTLQLVRIATKTTFDSSRTPEAGEATVTPRAFAKVDLEQLGERIRASIVKAKADDPRELRRRIVELERHLVKERADYASAIPEVREVRVEVPVLNGQVDDLREIAMSIDRFAVGLADTSTRLVSAAASITTAIERVTAAPRPAPDVIPATTAGPALTRPSASSGNLPGRTGAPHPPVRDNAAQAVASGAPTLGKADRLILATLAQHPEGLSRTKLAILTGYPPKGSSLRNALGTLRGAGLVSATGEPIQATAAGVATVGDVETLPPVGPELIAWWTSRLGLAERAILDVLVAAYPGDVTRAHIAERTGYPEAGSSIRNALGRLRGLGLVEGWHASGDLVDR